MCLSPNTTLWAAPSCCWQNSWTQTVFCVSVWVCNLEDGFLCTAGWSGWKIGNPGEQACSNFLHHHCSSSRHGCFSSAPHLLNSTVPLKKKKKVLCGRFPYTIQWYSVSCNVYLHTSSLSPNPLCIIVAYLPDSSRWPSFPSLQTWNLSILEKLWPC